jgi:hypothetical protein
MISALHLYERAYFGCAQKSISLEILGLQLEGKIPD